MGREKSCSPWYPIPRGSEPHAGLIFSYISQVPNEPDSNETKPEFIYPNPGNNNNNKKSRVIQEMKICWESDNLGDSSQGIRIYVIPQKPEMLAWLWGGFPTYQDCTSRWANRSGISSVFGLESQPWMDSRTVTCLNQKRSRCLALIFFVICDFDLFSNGPVKIIIKICEALQSLHLGTQVSQTVKLCWVQEPSGRGAHLEVNKQSTLQNWRIV